ncbi:hypothetical protein NDN08_002131 [Rhodosorus marinus]|uniref:ER membrane protein complex subunit 1 n=1 Tax=Rhodosorus marinus TaxID=101924 RepID=A0AAV8USV6_9RHOD|nr:hypothetical protein NDN08_002131 [Rhodosorus marinus]
MIRLSTLFCVLALGAVFSTFSTAEKISSTITFSYDNARNDPQTPTFLSYVFPLEGDSFGVVGKNGYNGIGCEYFEITRGSYVVSERKLLVPHDSQCQVAARTRNGDIVIAGTRSYSGEDAGVQRFDSNRDLSWDHPFDFIEDDFPTGVIELRDGSIVVAEAEILKLDADGNRLWRKFFSPGQYYRERGGGIVEVENLNIISSMNSGGDLFVHKISKSGTLLWRKKLSTTGSFCSQERNAAPVYGADGSYFVGCTTNLDHDTSAPQNYRVHKLGKGGQILWKKTITEIPSTVLYSMLADEDGGVVLGGSNIIKLDADGNVKWEMGSQLYRGPMERTPYGYIFRTLDGFQEIVPDITPSDTYTPSGSIVALKSSGAGLFLSKDNASDQVYAESEVARFASQWMMIGEPSPGSLFSLRSTVNGRVATLIKEGAEVVLKASTWYNPNSWNTRLKFRLRNVGAGEEAVQSARQGFGYLRPEEGSERGRIIASTSRANDRKMKVSLSSGPVPLSGSKVILRMSAQNRLVETTGESQIRAVKVLLPSKIKSFLFTVMHSRNGKVELQSRLTGKKLEVDVGTGRVTATRDIDRPPSDKAEFFMEIGNKGYISLVPAAPALNMACLVVDPDGWVVASGRKGSKACEIFVARKV